MKEAFGSLRVKGLALSFAISRYYLTFPCVFCGFVDLHHLIYFIFHQFPSSLPSSLSHHPLGFTIPMTSPKSIRLTVNSPYPATVEHPPPSIPSSLCYHHHCQHYPRQNSYNRSCPAHNQTYRILLCSSHLLIPSKNPLKHLYPSNHKQPNLTSPSQTPTATFPNIVR